MSEEQSNTEEKSRMEFIPFTAINEFMRTDYRMILLRNTLISLPNLAPKTQSSINNLTKKHVKVPGFRNSAKAPASVKAVAMVKSFEKEPKLVATIISAWSEINSDLRQQIFDLLNSFGWKLLPPQADRTKLPGFLTQWPEENDYEFIYEQFTETYPDSEYGIDDVSLMAVWLALRLPVEKVSKEKMVDLPFTPESPQEEQES